MTTRTNYFIEMLLMAVWVPWAVIRLCAWLFLAVVTLAFVLVGTVVLWRADGLKNWAQLARKDLRESLSFTDR